MQDKVIVGCFGKVYGIKGWLHVISYTDPKKNILDYQPWLIHQDGIWQETIISSSKLHNKTIIVHLPNVNDRTLAQTYTNCDIAILRKQLPRLKTDEYYWSDLEGMTVINKNNKILGTVSHLLATGANDVLVVKNSHEHLIPFINDVIISIKQETITVDWDEL